MPAPVPVASNLLESRFLGFSVKRLIESLAIPLAPCAVLYTIGFPLLFTFPLFVIGIGIGGLIFLKTPPGQRPLRYAHAVFRYKTGSNVYVWRHPDADDGDMGRGVSQDEWLTTHHSRGQTDQLTEPSRGNSASPGIIEHNVLKPSGHATEDQP